jgi:KUP system potassium uptake protein
VLFVMRADNNGEGGVLALMALALRRAAALAHGQADHDVRHLRRLHVLRRRGDHAGHLGAVGVEGLEIAAPGLSHFVIPITLLILACCS